MLRHKNIERVCLIVLAVMLLVTFLFFALAASGVIVEDTHMDYETRLFDQSRVHTIDITMANWDSFLETATAEEYADCQMIIDGEVYKNVAIRAKGNTSLSSVKQYGNNRYSFKVEFDHYQDGMTYHGLDKLSLNNLIQDNTYLKDYTAYTLMGKMGVAAPLCSFVQINVNGEPWGLYLAVEAVEDSFLSRNYGNDHGELYKPDSTSFGGGRGNGRNFDAEKMMEQFADFEGKMPQMPTWGELPDMANMRETTDTPDMGDMPDMNVMPNMGSMPDMANIPNMRNMPQTPLNRQMPDVSEAFEMPDMDNVSQQAADSAKENIKNNRGGGFMNGMGSDDVKLIYTDDDPASYANIFNNAKTDVTEADQARLIASLKALGEGDASVVHTDAVIRYMAIHNFLCNGDSYTGSMVHNYYLYEEDGVLEMIPWDYNLAMGSFSGGDAASTVNTGIDNLVSGTGDRPMADWILADEETAAQYHAVYQTFMNTVFSSGWFEQEITRVIDMISPYVKNDPTAFCTYETFENAADVLRTFCLKRAESIELQLSGELAATSELQDAAKRVDTSGLNLRDMGGMNGMGGMGDSRQDVQNRSAFTAMPDSEQTRRSAAGFRKTETANGTLTPDALSSGKTRMAPTENAVASPAEAFSPPNAFMQRNDSNPNPAQPVGLLILCAATLLAALILVKRSKPHQ